MFMLEIPRGVHNSWQMPQVLSFNNNTLAKHGFFFPFLVFVMFMSLWSAGFGL